MNKRLTEFVRELREVGGKPIDELGSGGPSLPGEKAAAKKFKPEPAEVTATPKKSSNVDMKLIANLMATLATALEAVRGGGDESEASGVKESVHRTPWGTIKPREISAVESRRFAERLR